MNLQLAANIFSLVTIAIFIGVFLIVAIPEIYEFLRVSFRRVYYRKEIAAQKAREAYYDLHPEHRPVCHALLTTKQWEKIKSDAQKTIENVDSRDKEYDQPESQEKGIKLT